MTLSPHPPAAPARAAAAFPTTRILLVEDNPGDVELVHAMLAESVATYDILDVPRLDAAVTRLLHADIDVILLDLRLPDCSGVSGIRTLRDATRQTPIVVLTGSDDRDLALACLDAGAQDYLAKSEATPHNLERAIGYAITRVRETQVRELQQHLERYGAMSSTTQVTSVTAALAGAGAVSARSPETFERIVAGYLTLLEPTLGRVRASTGPARADMERIVTQLGDAHGGPRDLLDVHLAALDRATTQRDAAHAASIVYEARLVALEMMGLLVDYYRVGQRRRFASGGDR